MTDKALEYCARGIVRYLAGDVDKFREFVDKAMNIHKATLCTCGNAPIRCRYGRKQAELCTNCGRVWRDGKVIQKCLVGGRLHDNKRIVQRSS